MCQHLLALYMLCLSWPSQYCCGAITISFMCTVEKDPEAQRYSAGTLPEIGVFFACLLIFLRYTANTASHLLIRWLHYWCTVKCYAMWWLCCYLLGGLVGSWGNGFSFTFIPFLSPVSVSACILEVSGGHDILELYLKKIFCLCKDIHCDNCCQSAKLKGIVVNNKGGWLPKTLKLNGQPSFLNRYLRIYATNYLWKERASLGILSVAIFFSMWLIAILKFLFVISLLMN